LPIAPNGDYLAAKLAARKTSSFLNESAQPTANYWESLSL
jgi:hypothetical protein